MAKQENKGSKNFKVVIEQHLQGVAQHNSIFAEKLKNPKKNIDDCITYILNQVKQSGSNGFEDTEIFGMAMHYYDEEDVKPGDKINANVVVNHEIQLTEEEIKELKEKARQKVIDDEMARLKKKPDKKSEYKQPEKANDNTLFD